MLLRTCCAALAMLCSPIVFAQLTMDQKISDFQHMASVYAKRYGPYEWKRDTIKFDLLDLAPWLDRLRKTKTDLEFYDLSSEYVASLNDAHDAYVIPSGFVARLNFGVDIYDGKLLVESISRTRLPASEFPFLVGYELVSIDGQDAQKILDRLMRYDIAANPRSTRRFAATLLTVRPQSVIANAPDVPEISTVLFRRPDGNLETYRIPWTRSGLPLTNIGKFATPQSTRQLSGVVVDGSDDEPGYPSVLARLQNCKIPDRELLNFNAVPPIFAASMPAGFTQRLGKVPSDPFYSGVFEAGGYKIGYLRIPTFAPGDTAGAVNAFAAEMIYFRANTDGLILDVMRNGGGSGSYTNILLSLLMTAKWRAIPFEIRPTSEWIAGFSSELEFYKSIGQQDYADLLQLILDELVAANSEGRSRTKPLPVDDVTIDRDPAMDSKGNVIAYTKPLMVLVDETSASAAEIFAATIQDNTRGPLLGWRTMGAGGNVESWLSGSYSQAHSSVTESLMIRRDPVITDEYPAAPYVENIGVRPDIQVDYMTADNLMNAGRPFVDAFVSAMVDNIRKNK